MKEEPVCLPADTIAQMVGPINTFLSSNGIGIRNVEIRVNGYENMNIYYSIEISPSVNINQP